MQLLLHIVIYLLIVFSCIRLICSTLHQQHVDVMLTGWCRFRLRGVAEYGLAKLWQEYIVAMSIGDTHEQFAKRTGLSATAVKNAIHCIGQVSSHESMQAD